MAWHYSEYYDAAVTAAGEQSQKKRWSRPMKLLQRHKQGGSLLDLGCSSGGFLASVDSHAWNLYGIEMSAAVAARARTRTGADVFVGDILEAGYKPESFDAITCFHLLEHVYDPRQVLANVCEWLKPGGVFILYLPNIQSAGARVFGSYWFALELPRHLYHFSPDTLRKFAKGVGLEEVQIRTLREPFIETSLRYIKEAFLDKIGISWVPLANSGKPNAIWRITRKGCRLTVVPILNRLLNFVGPGEVIEAVLVKPLTAQRATVLNSR